MGGGMNRIAKKVCHKCGGTSPKPRWIDVPINNQSFCGDDCILAYVAGEPPREDKDLNEKVFDI